MVPQEKIWKYCRNQVANAIEEGKTPNVNFVAAGTSGLSPEGFGTADRLKALEYSLAGFLVARSRQLGPWTGPDGEKRGDFFGFDHQFAHIPNSVCNHTRWGDCSHSWPEVEAAYAKDYGVPLDDAVESTPGRFFRRYSKVNVTFDCGKHGPSMAQYDWIPSVQGRSSN